VSCDDLDFSIQIMPSAMPQNRVMPGKCVLGIWWLSISKKKRAFTIYPIYPDFSVF